MTHHSEQEREAVLTGIQISGRTLYKLDERGVNIWSASFQPNSGYSEVEADKAAQAVFGCLSASRAPAAGGLEAVRAEIKEYAPAGGDRVMIWVNDRDTRQGGYCLECVPRHVAPIIVAALAAPAATSAETHGGDGVREGLIDSINQAETYLSQHIETYHDYEDDTPERASLRGIQHHLIGSLIADDGSFLAPAVESAQVKEALDVAREYVVDGLSAQDQKRRDVEGYPGLMKREQGRLDEVRADLALVDRIRASLATAEG